MCTCTVKKTIKLQTVLEILCICTPRIIMERNFPQYDCQSLSSDVVKFQTSLMEDSTFSLDSYFISVEVNLSLSRLSLSPHFLLGCWLCRPASVSTCLSVCQSVRDKVSNEAGERQMCLRPLTLSHIHQSKFKHTLVAAAEPQGWTQTHTHSNTPGLTRCTHFLLPIIPSAHPDLRPPTGGNTWFRFVFSFTVL